MEITVKIELSESQVEFVRNLSPIVENGHVYSVSKNCSTERYFDDYIELEGMGIFREELNTENFSITGIGQSVIGNLND